MGYQADKDFDEGLAWELYGVICMKHKLRYRSDLGSCPYCEDGVEPEEDLDPRGFPGDD
jgi:hypothetical protein